MAPYVRIKVALGTVAGTAATAEWVLAQTATTGPTAPSETSALGSGVFVLVALVGILLAALITAVSLYDMKRRQEASAMILQARLSDALLLDPILSEYPITASVNAPLRRRSPIIVDIAGSVASPDLGRAALDVVTRETKGMGREVRIEDRMIVNPVMAARAA